jgi:hypothetical protein
MAGMGENRKYFLRMAAIVGGALVSIHVLLMISFFGLAFFWSPF